MAKIQVLSSEKHLPPNFISAEGLALVWQISPRWAQKIIKNTVSDQEKVRVGHTIYAPFHQITPPRGVRGNKNMRSSEYQQLLARKRWHPEERETIEALLAKYKTP